MIASHGFTVPAATWAHSWPPVTADGALPVHHHGAVPPSKVPLWTSSTGSAWADAVVRAAAVRATEQSRANARRRVFPFTARISLTGLGAGQPVVGDHPGVPVGAALRGAALGRVVDVHDAEPLGIPLRPLEV